MAFDIKLTELIINCLPPSRLVFTYTTWMSSLFAIINKKIISTNRGKYAKLVFKNNRNHCQIALTLELWPRWPLIWVSSNCASSKSSRLAVVRAARFCHFAKSTNCTWKPSARCTHGVENEKWENEKKINNTLDVGSVSYQCEIRITIIFKLA